MKGNCPITFRKMCSGTIISSGFETQLRMFWRKHTDFDMGGTNSRFRVSFSVQTTLDNLAVATFWSNIFYKLIPYTKEVFLKKYSVLYKVCKGKCDNQQKWDKITRSLIKKCCTKGTQDWAHSGLWTDTLGRGEFPRSKNFNVLKALALDHYWLC